jgi:amylosucrase
MFIYPPRLPAIKTMTSTSMLAYKERLQSSLAELRELYNSIYGNHPMGEQGFQNLLELMEKAFAARPARLKERDEAKSASAPWFASNSLCGMSLYVDRFCGSINELKNRLDYFEDLGVNVLHLMPIFESPEHASDGGYAVSNFRKLSERFGTIADLRELEAEMRKRNMYLMLDIVLNHTSDQHEWALKARQGDKYYQDYYYFFNDRTEPDEYERSMPEIFPGTAPGNFTYINDCNKWVMTVFHNYQWDLNYTNPGLFIEMLDTIYFYANLGTDILRIDAPAFIWKEKGTNCQNLPKAHTILQLIKLCVQLVSPGMALLGEAIVRPQEIMKYFGEGARAAKECDFAYNATQMALQWDALATQDVSVMMAAQHELLKKPFGTSWITYTRCHDDIGLGYEDYMISAAGFNPYAHRQFLKDYYSGKYFASDAKGALFAVNEKTGDARISGTLASLCGLEAAINNNDVPAVELSIQKILMMQAMSCFIGGLPMLFYGDETGHLNDYSYLHDASKFYDNRWMHRPVIDWEKNRNVEIPGSVENRIFTGTKKLLRLRKKLPVVADKANITWLRPYNIHVAAFFRAWDNDRVYCLFNFSKEAQALPWRIFRENGMQPVELHDHWSEQHFQVGRDDENFMLPPFAFFILAPRQAAGS